MAEKGSTRLTSKEVGQRAGLKPTLVNYYFGSREGLLQAVISAVSEETGRRLDAASLSDGSLDERLRRLVGALLHSFADEPYSPRLLFEQVIFADEDAQERFVAEHGRAHIEAIRQVLDVHSGNDRLRTADPVLAISAIGGVCTFLCLMTPLLKHVLDVPDLSGENVDRIADAVTDILLHGLLQNSEVDP
jgi:AcrR family transcriptional regulator